MKFYTIISLSILSCYTASSANIHREIDLQRRIDHGEQSSRPETHNQLSDDAQNQSPAQPAVYDSEGTTDYERDDDASQVGSLESLPGDVADPASLETDAIVSEEVMQIHRVWPGYESTKIYEEPNGDEILLIVGNDVPNIKKAWQAKRGEAFTRVFHSIKSENLDLNKISWSKIRGLRFMALKPETVRVSYQESLPYLRQVQHAKVVARFRRKKLAVVWENKNEEYRKDVKMKDLPGRKKRDLVSKEIAARSSEPETYTEYALLKDYAAMNKSGTAPPRQIATLIDVSSGTTARKRAASENVFQQLSSQTDSSLSKTAKGAATQFLQTFTAFQTVQANISETIFPILTDMTSKTNSSLIFQAALSIWVDLTAPNLVTVGPFLYGFTCLDELEIAQAKEMNMSIDDPAFESYRAVSAILLDIYEDAWNRSFTAANRTGLLDRLYTLGSYLSESSNSTIAPDSFRQVQNTTLDDSFFVDYNRNGNLDRFLM